MIDIPYDPKTEHLLCGIDERFDTIDQETDEVCASHWIPRDQMPFYLVLHRAHEVGEVSHKLPDFFLVSPFALLAVPETDDDQRNSCGGRRLTGR